MRESQKCVVGKTTADRYSTGTKQSKAKKKKKAQTQIQHEREFSLVILTTLHSALSLAASSASRRLCVVLLSPTKPLPVPRRAMCSLWAPRSPPRWASSLSRSWGSSWERKCRSCWNRCKRRSRRTGRFCRWLSNPCYCLSFFFYIYFDHCRKKKNLNKIKSASGLKRYEAAAEKWNIPVELFRQRDGSA